MKLILVLASCFTLFGCASSIIYNPNNLDESKLAIINAIDVPAGEDSQFSIFTGYLYVRNEAGKNVAPMGIGGIRHALLLPGKYEITGTCNFLGRTSIPEISVTVKAGKKYRMECKPSYNQENKMWYAYIEFTEDV